MDHWMLTELLEEQRRRALDDFDGRRIDEARAMMSHGVREYVAAALVRLGMTLDRSAGERVLAPVPRDTHWEDGHGVCS